MASVSNASIGKFTLEYEQLPIFEGRFSSPLRINVAEIAEAFVPFISEPSSDNTEPIVVIENASGFEHRTLSCTFELEGETDTFSCYVIPGGISRQNLKQHIQAASDIFQTRFLNPKENFFLTTRTNSRVITLKETELYPLYFLLQSSNAPIVIKECVTGCTVTAENLGSRGVAVLDIAALRRYFAEHENILASVFNVYYGSTLSCRIVVEHCQPAKERYLLKFRNSLGVFEIIEIVGELSVTPDYSDNEGATFNRYDSDIDEFYSERDRVSRKQNISIKSVFKSSDELDFLMDMIASEDVRLLDYAPIPVKVIPSVEDFTYTPHPKSPQTVNIKFELTNPETNISQDIDINAKNRLFSKQFSKQFN